VNPDVFITIAFAGIVLLVTLLSLVVVLPQVRRESAGVQQRERTPEATSVTTRRSRGKAEADAAAH
jgi:hypothetical protein